MEARAGLTISAVIVLLLANLVDLTAIASLGSVVALAIFLAGGRRGTRLRYDTGASAGVLMTAVLTTSVVMLWTISRAEPKHPWPGCTHP